MNRRTLARAGQRALGYAVAISGLFPRRRRYRDFIEQELVGLASHVAAAVSSAQCILSRAPDGPERQRLLHACEQLARAADGVVDPRSEFQHLSESGLEDAIDAFVGYQEQSASLRAAALAVARKREPAPRVIRKASRDQQAPVARCSATETRPGGFMSWTRRMRTRTVPRSARGSDGSLGLVWRYIGKVLEGCIRTPRSGA
jgi:hypothetical protein